MMLSLLIPLLAACAPSADTGALDTGAVSAGQEVWVLLDWTDTETSIDAGWMVSFSVELLPCQESAGLSLVPVARAGHGLTGEEALRQLRAPRVESLTARTQSQLGHLTPNAGSYCELFYLTSFTTAVYDSVGLPDEIDMVGDALSLFVERSGRRLAAHSGYGVKRTIVDANGDPDPLEITDDGSAALLRLYRDVSVLDMVRSTDADAATSMLASLAESTVVVREH